MYKLSEITKGSVMIVDHARALKENGLISPTDYLKIIDRVNEYIDVADKNVFVIKDKDIIKGGNNKWQMKKR